MTDTNLLKEVCAYIRVSTHMQEELSPDAQIRLLKEYASSNGMVITKVYEDLGISGTKALKRPGFQEMIADCKSKEHPFDAIIVWKFSRFARNQEESIVYKSLLKKENVEVVSVSEPLPDGFIGSLVERIFEWMDEYYSIRLSGEVKRGMTQKALKGGYQGRMPLGYERNKSDIPRIVKSESLIVKRIFNMYIEKNGCPSDIAIILNREGVRNKQGHIFDAKKINYIITNPFYIGKVRWNYWNSSTKRFNTGDEVIVADAEHEPIISNELWERTQELYRYNKSRYKARGYRRGTAGTKHWLTGTLRCSECGGPMTYGTNTSRNTDVYFFQCSRRSKGRCTTSSYINANKAEQTVLNALHEILSSDKISYKRNMISEAPSETIELLNAELKKLDAKEKRMKDAYLNEVDTLDEYRDNKKAIASQRKFILSQLKEAEKDTVTIDPEAYEKEIRNSIQNIIDMIENRSEDNASIGSALREHVSDIMYDKANDHMTFYLF